MSSILSNNQYRHWRFALANKDRRPAYLMIADLIAADIESGVLHVRDKLPTLRELSSMLALDYTTVARAYKEARERGLIDSSPGAGSYVKGKSVSLSLRGGTDIEMTMNSPPEPSNPALLDKLNQGFTNIAGSDCITSLLRYQNFGGTYDDKQAATTLLSKTLDEPKVECVLACPGTHSVLLGLLSSLATDGMSICVESLVYPGLKAIAAQLKVPLVAIDGDSDGPLIYQMEALCKSKDIAAIYLNPTIQNPTTHTINKARREAIADIAIRYSIPIIEDDAYGMLPETPTSAIANLAPELTYYITGLAKYFGAGLRTAYVHAPNKASANRLAGAMRALSVMSSPITNKLATMWLQDGTVEQMTSEIRRESQARQTLAKTVLQGHKYFAHADGFHLWIHLPKSVEVNPSTLAAYLRTQNVSVVSSAAFCTNNNPPHAIRMCLGGPQARWECEKGLTLITELLADPEKLTLALANKKVRK